MVGSLVLRTCLERDDVEKITLIGRKKTGTQHPKVEEIVHHDFLDFSGIVDHFRNQDVCFYCIGAYTGSVSREVFSEITVLYTNAFAETIRLYNDNTSFCLLSGRGADLSGQSKIMFAREKGKAEKLLIGLSFAQLYLFRPGYIYPVSPRKEPNLGYHVVRLLYKPVLSRLLPKFGVTSEQLAKAMVKIGLDGGKQMVYENSAIRDIL